MLMETMRSPKLATNQPRTIATGPSFGREKGEDGGYGGQKTDYAEVDPEDLEGGELSLELLFVAQAGKEGLVCLALFGPHGSHGRQLGVFLCTVHHAERMALASDRIGWIEVGGVPRF